MSSPTSVRPLTEYTRPSTRGSSRSPMMRDGNWQMVRLATSPTSVVPAGHSAAVGGGAVGGGVVGGGVAGGGVLRRGGGHAPSAGDATLWEPPPQALSASAAVRVIRRVLGLLEAAIARCLRSSGWVNARKPDAGRTFPSGPESRVPGSEDSEGSYRQG